MPKQKPGKSKQDYATPDSLIWATCRLLGIYQFRHDFAADEANHKGLSYWDEETDSLSKSAKDWAIASTAENGSGWGWLNPPYGDIGPWALRCLEASLLGGRIAFLVPASVGSNWYRDFIHGQSGVKVLFLNGRIPFMPDKPTWLYPKDCALILFGTGQPFESDVWTWR